MKISERVANKLFLFTALFFALAATGCRSFLTRQALKSYTVEVPAADSLTASNRYQQDFVYLKILAREVVPLEDRCFPPAQRAALEQSILQKLAATNCTYDDFLDSLEDYLRAFNNEHAYIVQRPEPKIHTARAPLYPIHVQYLNDDLYLADLSRDYDASLIGQKITAINGHSIADIEQKFSSVATGENPWTKRTSLEDYPFPYRRPELYHRFGITDSISNHLELEFADHAPVSIAPSWTNNIRWQHSGDRSNPLTAEVPHQYDCHVFPEQHLAYFQYNACFDKTAILDGLQMVKPWVRPLVRAWLETQFHRTEVSGVLRGIYDPDRPVLQDYLATTVSNLHQLGITNLILDLRHNAGGETSLTYQFIYFLTQRDDLRDMRAYVYNPDVFAYYNPKDYREFHDWYFKKFGAEPPSKQLTPTPDDEHPFFYDVTNTASVYRVAPGRPVFSGNIVVLANQNTGSAASMFTGLLQDNHLAVIVGTPTGNNPTGPTGMTPFKLPHSGILVSLPTDYVERAQPAGGDILQPDYWSQNSVADNHAGRDTPFDDALQLLHVTNAPSTQKIHAAEVFLRELKKSGGLPGWAKTDVGQLTVETCPDANTITFTTRKRRDSALYHYTVTQPSPARSFILTKANRTTEKGNLLHEYPTP